MPASLSALQREWYLTGACVKAVEWRNGSATCGPEPPPDGTPRHSNKRTYEVPRGLRNSSSRRTGCTGAVYCRLAMWYEAA
ncbi:hypothetical protein NDU88_001314 [Pleurodeles waltl]|uniref:Uncharacterized protein n=1 Tax=Pleurodeles waltl TaxID=8319 RepID=A0AAV7Q883_PLEWA|nr:hypothetical protein NDU88_001314 [Pleurodeles waltl]